jgi:hypothetical protein
MIARPLETLDRTIAAIVMNLGLGQNEIQYQDFIEWIADGLQHIGAYYQMIEKEAVVVVENYQAVMPCDLYKVIDIRQHIIIPQHGPGGFYGGSLQQILCSNGFDLGRLDAYDRFRILPVAGLSKPNQQNPPDDVQFNKGLISPTDKHTGLDFNVQQNLITTAFSHGAMVVRYLAFPVDDRGWPMVPDEVSYRDALFWKVAYHLSMREPEMFKNPQMRDINFTYNKWQFYCKQARGGANMPDLMMMDRLKNNWMRLVNTYDDSQNGYSMLGKPQNLGLSGRA